MSERTPAPMTEAAEGRLRTAQAWSNRMSVVTGALFLALGIKWGLEAWRCPLAESLFFTTVMLTLGVTNLVDYFASDRDRLPLMTWCHTVGFVCLTVLAYVHPQPFYIGGAVLWGLLSIMGPVLALCQPAREHVARISEVRSTI